MRYTTILSLLLATVLFGCNSTDRVAADATSSDAQPNTPDASLTETYWKLTQLDAHAVQMDDEQEREVYFILKTDDTGVTGFSGCNTLNGKYELEEGKRIRFTEMATTMMACPDLEIDESAVLEVFNLTDNYTIAGDTLSLNVGRRAPLAIFEAVYLH